MAARDPLHGLVADETPGGVPAAASWRAVFDHTPAGLVLRNAGGRITDCNAAAERLLGLSRAQLLGQDAIDPAWKALDGQGNALAPEQDPGLQTLRSGQALQCVDFGVEMPGGERRWLSVSTSLLPSEGGVGVVVSFTDDTVHRHLQRAQAEQWQRLRATLDGTRTATWEWNLQTGETRLSERWAEIVGYTLAELSPTTIDTWQALVHPDDTQASTAQWERHLAGELPLFDIECRLRHRDGSWRWVRNRGRLSSTTAKGQPLWVFGTHEDITERKVAEIEAASAHALLQALFELAPLGISLIDTHSGRAVMANNTLCAMLGRSRDDLRAMDISACTPAELRPERALRFQQALDEGHCASFETVLLHADGRPLHVLGSGARAIHADGRPHVWAVAQDISARKAMELELVVAATQDRLTGLPNRGALSAALECAAERARREPAYAFAVLFLDFDRFKLINDTLGHAAGDELLQAMAGRLQQALPRNAAEPWTLARFGGDEFVLLAPGLSTPEAARRFGDELIAVLEQPQALQGQVIRTSASIGVAFGHGDQVDAQTLLRDADIAMYEAKRGGRGRLAVFGDKMLEQLSRAVKIEGALHFALGLNQMHLVYQPIVDLDTGRMTSVESLLRWTHPVLGVVSPAEFIPIAEESGHVVALGEWVMRQSCVQWARWQAQDAASAPGTVSVNVSRAQLRQAGRLLALVRSALAEAGMPATALQLEITEREVSHEATDTRELMQTLCDMGVRLAMDDFGTGASSLGCLREFPFHTIKIDKSFVTDLCRDPHVLAVAHATVNVIENLGMVSVAEGIEEPGELATLQALGCRYGQGFLFGRPMAADVLLAAMAQP